MTQPTAIKALLAGGFGLLIAIIILLGIGSVRVVDTLAELTSKLYQHPLTVSNAVLEANANIISMHRHMKDVPLARTSEDLELAISRVTNAEARVYEHFDTVMDRFLGDKSRIEEARQSFTDWKAIRAEVIALVQAGKIEEAAAITKGKGARHVVAMIEQMDGLIAFARNKAAEFLAHSKAEHGRSDDVLYGLLTMAAAMSGLVAAFVLIRVHRAEEAWAESEARLSLHFQNTPLAAIFWDENFCCTQWNKAAEEMFGFTAEEAIGRHATELVLPDAIKDEINELFQVLLDQKSGTQNINVNVTKDGRTIVCEWYNTPIIRKGKPIGVASLTQDISKRRRAEEALREARQHLEERVEARTESDPVSLDTELS